ncbi:DUF4301 family protein [Flavobacterium selenitireducens]|uniref:DUF4301 family protein n=1 Tax=Flavobacterium selenitireducens TaxID=2722704 RepID=UPI00168C0FB7|nr:DUF4301 family protein [Flavobacterium selenitireducens]MBD3582298.1 DUF4301 family protein [Flavobacterium selenitireducens]
MEKNTEQLPSGNPIIAQEVRLRKIGFSTSDFEQIRNHGLSLDTIEKELEIFRQGIPKTWLERPATLKDGILAFSESDFREAAAFFDSNKERFKLKKFVPASGAASRMFKFLSTFLNEFDSTKDTINAYINRTNMTSLSIFLAGKDNLPFYKDLVAKVDFNKKDGELRESDRRNYDLIKTLLAPDQFDYCNKPKGVLPFHKYSDHVATPIEEHLREGARYASSNGISYVHFTVSKEHQGEFESVIAATKPTIEAETGMDIRVSFSYQDKQTDTIGVDLKNDPFRDDNGHLVFRPGGHGALINNLNAIDADIVFIKNIDNVIQNHIEVITLYKKALGGILMATQQKIFDYLRQIESDYVEPGDIDEMIDFLKKELNVFIYSDFHKFTNENKIAFIRQKLNRPLRICGMVKNEGEPGGGPFWVRGQQGNISLQIVETSQVELNNPQQVAIIDGSTHFNPVDIVCSIKDFKGEKFDLTEFIDHERGFIVNKAKNGRELKAYELPGLWNGAMAKWNTIFVEVPLVTFNPVKTVNDLLKPAHQPQNGQG